MIEIRLGQLADLEDLDVINAEVAYPNPSLLMQESIEAERIYVAVAEGGSVVGYGLIQFLWGDTPLLSLLKVLPGYQGTGIGTQLLAAVESKLSSGGYKSLFSSTDKTNELSQKFHIKHGFEKIGELDMDHGVEWFLKKQLAGNGE